MAKKFKTDKPTAEDIIRLRKPNEKTVEILLEPTLKEAIEKKQAEVDYAVRMEQRKGKSLNTRGAESLQAELDQMIEDAQSETVEFHFRDIGRKKLDALVLAHPPTDEQKQQWKDEGNQGVLGYNLETFPPALIAATAFDPELSLAQAQQICDEWGGGDIEALFYGALAACKERTSIPLSKRGYGRTNNSPLNSTSVSEMVEPSAIPTS